MTKYWKVTRDPKTRVIPGYATTSKSIISSYLSAMLSSGAGSPGSNSYKNPDEIIYVIEFNINTDKLVEMEDPLFGYNQDRTVMPGYFGPADPNNDAHPTTDPLEVIVYNKTVSAKIVGAYKVKSSIDTAAKSYSSGYYIKGSNFIRDSKTGNWTTDDLNMKTASYLNMAMRLID